MKEVKSKDKWLSLIPDIAEKNNRQEKMAWGIPELQSRAKRQRGYI